MIGDKIIEINQFNLSYDGLFIIKFEFENEIYRLKPYLTPALLFKIIENEGLKDSIELLDFYSNGIDFSKTTLMFEVFEKENENDRISFLTSEYAEMYQDDNIYLIHCEIKSDE